MDRRWCEEHAKQYMLIGDMDKPFHRPECDCEACERWRKFVGRPTHEELRRGDLLLGKE